MNEERIPQDRQVVVQKKREVPVFDQTSLRGNYFLTDGPNYCYVTVDIDGKQREILVPSPVYHAVDIGSEIILYGWLDGEKACCGGLCVPEPLQ